MFGWIVGLFSDKEDERVGTNLALLSGGVRFNVTVVAAAGSNVCVKFADGTLEWRDWQAARLESVRLTTGRLE